MTSLDLIAEAYAAVTVNKIRTGLTMLGIIIGIASVIALISVGEGAQGTIQSRIQGIGSNLVMIQPGFQRGVQVRTGRGSATTLTSADSDAIMKEVPSISAIAPEVSRRYQVTARGKNTNTQVIGTVPAYLSVRNVQVDKGSFFLASQIESAGRVAVVGPTVRDDLFGTDVDPVGQTIRINKVDFKVIGMTVAKGGGGFGGNADDSIFVPITSAQRYLSGTTFVTGISVEAQDQPSMAAVQSGITSLLLARHGISDPTQADFSVLSQADIVNAASAVTQTFTLLLASIAGISLVVGGIGIMNMMLTTVTERIREIGLRKAVGAKRRSITAQFLAEAIMLTLAGGLIGIVAGWAIAYAISQLAGIATTISLSSIGLAFGVSALIGIVFGYYPARRAAALNPIEALRYE